MILRKALWMGFVLLMLAQTGLAQLSPQAVSIQMRDGKFLAGDLYLPNPTDSFPLILIQTPYNKTFYQANLPLGVGQNLAASEYAFLVVDWRCFYGSAAACVATPNRGEDGYDVVEWAAQQSWCNGQIGTWGPSALGNIQYQTARERPPHLVCCAPLVASPQTYYEGYYPGGALRTELVETLGFLFGTLALVVANPHDNFLWDFTYAGSMYPSDVDVPMFLIAGWYDHNIQECIQMMDTLRDASGPGVRDQHKMLIGPWVHGGTGQASVGTTVQGELSYPLASHWNDSLAMRFFDYHLRGQANAWDQEPIYRWYVLGEDRWETGAAWPPAGTQPQTWYLQDNLALTTSAPTGAAASLSYTYDPQDPSPTTGGKTLNLALDQGPYDQRFAVESRPDVLVFSSAPLTQDLAVAGEISVQLYVASDRLDTDFTLRLTDVYPDGRSMLLDESVLRMRFRNGFTVNDTAMMSPGQVYPIQLKFANLAQTFPAGHRIRLIVGSSNYPRYNRNMNTGGEMYPNDNIDTLVNSLVATNTVFLNTQFPSSITLPVRSAATAVAPGAGLPPLDILVHQEGGWVTARGVNGQGRADLLDLQGRVLRSCALRPHWQLSLLGLPAGTYLLRVQEGSTVKTGRFIYLD